MIPASIAEKQASDFQAEIAALKESSAQDQTAMEALRKRADEATHQNEGIREALSAARDSMAKKTTEIAKQQADLKTEQEALAKQRELLASERSAFEAERTADRKSVFEVRKNVVQNLHRMIQMVQPDPFTAAPRAASLVPVANIPSERASNSWWTTPVSTSSFPAQKATGINTAIPPTTQVDQKTSGRGTLASATGSDGDPSHEPPAERRKSGNTVRPINTPFVNLPVKTLQESVSQSSAGSTRKPLPAVMTIPSRRRFTEDDTTAAGAKRQRVTEAPILIPVFHPWRQRQARLDLGACAAGTLSEFVPRPRRTVGLLLPQFLLYRGRPVVLVQQCLLSDARPTRFHSREKTHRRCVGIHLPRRGR
ncbi:hypothetical protein C8R46DRAFT_1099321 [Mycena filopes]|nr:hypothetical protein C8R46DRAFT_1099321 [Mycena filopes]